MTNVVSCWLYYPHCHFTVTVYNATLQIVSPAEVVSRRVDSNVRKAETSNQVQDHRLVWCRKQETVQENVNQAVPLVQPYIWAEIKLKFKLWDYNYNGKLNSSRSLTQRLSVTFVLVKSS